MRLRAITIRRMPGIDRSFRVGDLADGLNLVVGPNGSGKTTLCRALQSLLWPEELGVEPASLVGEWDDDGAALRVEREGGRVVWQRDGLDDERPELPAGRFARCYTLGMRDLLLESEDTDTAIAEEVRRQMSGGYDVRALLDGAFAEKPQEGRAESSRIRRLQERLRELRFRTVDLAEREDLARDLEERLAAARKARSELELLRTARAVALARAGLEEARKGLAGLPAGMERIDGGEADWIAEVEADLAKARAELARCRRSGEDAERRIEAHRLPDGVAGGAELKAWLDRARKLQGLEEELARAATARAEAEGRREAAAKALDPEGTGSPPRRIGPEELTKIELFLHRVERLRSQRSALEAERRLLGETEPRETVSRRQLEQGIEALDGWLAAAALRRRVRTAWALPAALAALLAGAASGLLLHWFGWVLCGAGLGGLLLLLWVRTRVGRGEERLDFEELGLDPPPAWEPTSVRERRRSLQQSLDTRRDDERFAERRSVLDGKLAVTADAEAELEAERQALRVALGIDAGGGDLGLFVLADRVRAFRAAEEEQGEAVARVRLLNAERAEVLEQVNGFLGAAGLEPAADAAALIRRLEDLEERNAELAAARRDREEQVARETALVQEIERLEQREGKIFQRAGLEPGDREGLDRRLHGLEHYRELRSREERHREAVNQGLPALAGRDDLLGLSPEELGSELAGLEELASGAEDLSREIGAIEEAVRRARRDDAVERATAELAAAQERQAELLEDKLERAAGAFLLKSILDEYDRAVQPEVLTRAAELFAAFTRHEYGLILGPRAAAPEFRAVEASSGAGKSLAELSDATRIQLLLAARLAFATRADRRRRVPLFLDEVLTTSDPARFAAVGESLLVLVREEGRQVFYLTADPSDAARWAVLLTPAERERLRTVDLADVRRMAGAGEAAEIAPPPLPPVPAPEGMSAERYGFAIGAPPVEPHRPVESVHLFHLLHDDLGLLHRLLEAGIRTVGQWRLLASLGRVPGPVGEVAGARLSALADLAEAFFEAWSIGRGRPVDAEILRRADGVSDTFREGLTELAADLGGDARKLVRALEERRDPRVSGFREKKLEALKGWLIGEGHLDPREVLDEPAVQVRVLAAVAGHLEAGRLSTADVAAHVHRLFTLAGGVS